MKRRLWPALDARWRLVPFRARLTLGFAGAMVILFGGLALLLHTLVESSLDQQINRSLQTRVADLKPLVAGQVLPKLPDSGGTFAQLIDPSTGAVLDYTLGHAQPLLDRTQLRWADHRSGLVNDGPARLRVGPVATKPASVLVVGASLSQRNHTLTTISELLFAGGPVLLILTCIAGYILAARALAPVEKMSVQASGISGAPAGERLAVPEARDEIHRLGETLNGLLARVEEVVARERSFVADASHELRTPLAVLKLELEFALASDISRDELQERVSSAAEEVDRLTKVAQDLLLIARADQGRLPLEKREVEVEQVLGAVADRFEQPARMRGRSISSEHTDRAIAVAADQTWLEQALNNLVSNALRYGDGPVVLRACQQNGNVEFHVLDEGHGFDPAFLRRAFERFTRSDPARSGVGIGLGLSIVRAIAEAHGGSAGASNRDVGGADVWVSLPRLVSQ
jgi:two-component system, OmpR family, sensor kinase